MEVALSCPQPSGLLSPPSALAHLDSRGRRVPTGSRTPPAQGGAGQLPSLPVQGPEARALRSSALTLSTLPGKRGWASEDIPFPDPFYQLNQMRNSPHPFHIQNSQKVALETTGSQAARAVAWLLPKPENASISKDQNQVRDEKSLFCPQPPGHLSQLCASLMQMESGHSETVQLALSENC